MMSRETLRKLGILVVSFVLIVSPLAFGDRHEEPADPTAQSTDSASEPMSQQADPAAGDPNAQDDPAQGPGFGEGTEAMPGADDGEEEYEFENKEEEMPRDDEGDDSVDDEEQGW